jgi:hypothetical protein
MGKRLNHPECNSLRAQSNGDVIEQQSSHMANFTYCKIKQVPV